MSVFVTSTSSVSRHGAFAIERQPPAVLKAQGTGVALLVAQFPWGPDQTNVLTPASVSDRGLTLAPPGMSRTGAGYLSTIRRAFPTLKTIRVMGTAAAIAASNLLNATPATAVVVTLKYKGVAGNSVIATVQTASDLNANHFDLRVTVSGLSGSTEDYFQNINFSGTGADSVIDYTKARLVGTVTKSIASRPVNGTYTFSGGAEGTINAARYIGTAQAGDFGIAKAEGDTSIRHVYVDDPGNTDRAAVNAALNAHVNFMGDRSTYINGDSGQDVPTAQTTVGLNRSDRVIFVDPWVTISDDTDGTVRLVPPGGFAASVKSQISPSTSFAWKAQEIGDMLAGIVDLEQDRGGAIGGMTDQGIAVIIREDDGGFRFESDNTAITPSDPSRRRQTRRALADYIAIAFVRSVRAQVDSPNVEENQDVLKVALDGFMSTMKANKKLDANHLPFVVDYSIPNPDDVNTPDGIADGDFFLPLDVQTPSSMERIFLSLQAGELVVI